MHVHRNRIIAAGKHCDSALNHVRQTVAELVTIGVRMSAGRTRLYTGRGVIAGNGKHCGLG